MAKLEIEVVDAGKKAVGKVDLPEAAFGAEVKPALLYDIVKQQQANARAGTASTKKRGDVSGGGKKPWKQKHTGNARHGSIREPQWRHGGNIFGPMPRDYSYEIPKKMKKQALASALSLRHQEGKVTVVSELELPKGKPSTRAAVEALSKLGVPNSTLVLIGGRDKTLELSFRNLPGVKVLPVEGLNVRDVLRHDNLVLLKSAVDAVAKRMAS